MRRAAGDGCTAVDHVQERAIQCAVHDQAAGRERPGDHVTHVDDVLRRERGARGHGDRAARRRSPGRRDSRFGAGPRPGPACRRQRSARRRTPSWRRRWHGPPRRARWPRCRHRRSRSGLAGRHALAPVRGIEPGSAALARPPRARHALAPRRLPVRQHALQWFAWRISWAARSPIIAEGAAVLPLTRVGMMEASTTRRPSTPRTRSSGSSTARSSAPMRQVPTGW